MTTPKRLSSRLSVSPQIDPAELSSLAQAGFRSIISNRPDDEDPGQPSWAAMAEAAEAAGLCGRHIPVVPGAIGDEHVAQFRAALEELPGPVLAFCRTGARAASLWALSETPTLTPEEVLKTAADAGYDLTALRERIARREGTE